MPGETPILKLVSRRFTWTRKDGFEYHTGIYEHGLNRTREGVMRRIESQQSRAHARQRGFLSTLFDRETLDMLDGTTVEYIDGAHVVRGHRYQIDDAEIGD